MTKKQDRWSRRILICGVWYTIDLHKFAPEDQQWGGCTYNDKSILIEETLPEKHRITVLAHEVTHGVYREEGLDDEVEGIIDKLIQDVKDGKDVNSEEIALEIEELVCDAMEVGHKAFKNL